MLQPFGGKIEQTELAGCGFTQDEAAPGWRLIGGQSRRGDPPAAQPAAN